MAIDPDVQTMIDQLIADRIVPLENQVGTDTTTLSSLQTEVDDHEGRISALESPQPAPTPDPTPTPTSTPSPSPVPANAVPITTSDDANAIINAHPAGTNFVFATGKYLGLTLNMSGGNGYWGDPNNPGNVVFDGQNQAQVFFGGPADGCSLHGFTVQHYIGYQDRQGAAPICSIGGMTNLVVEDVVLTSNKYSGLAFGGADWQVRRTKFHNNGQYGFSGAGGSHLVEDCEVWSNGGTWTTGDRGGCKIVHSNGFTMQNVTAHDNRGRGLWYDGWNLNYTVDSCTVENNDLDGIDIEVNSGPGLVTNNTVRGNATSQPSWMPGFTQIKVSASPGCEVANNTVSGQRGILLMIDYGHSAFATMGTTICLANVSVHDNTMNCSDIQTGLVVRNASKNPGCASPFDPSAKNVWANNTYTGAGTFAWNGQLWDLATWQSQTGMT